MIPLLRGQHGFLRTAMLPFIAAAGYLAGRGTVQNAPSQLTDPSVWDKILSDRGLATFLVLVVTVCIVTAAWKILPKIVKGMDAHIDAIRELREMARLNQQTLSRQESLMEKMDRRMEFLEKHLIAQLPSQPKDV